jgi:hypothetical protein
MLPEAIVNALASGTMKYESPGIIEETFVVISGEAPFHLDDEGSGGWGSLAPAAGVLRTARTRWSKGGWE